MAKKKEDLIDDLKRALQIMEQVDNYLYQRPTPRTPEEVALLRKIDSFRFNRCPNRSTYPYPKGELF